MLTNIGNSLYGQSWNLELCPRVSHQSQLPKLIGILKRVIIQCNGKLFIYLV